ncbi:MAG TPA: hypothetical protein VJ180_13560 [Pyrinomonadaceae bacterium]|nr:hypothetical protein [Pyrinomonadaceae bacterium]
MSCPQCFMEIDYRFLTTCSRCGSEVQPAEDLARFPDPQNIEKTRNSFSLQQGLVSSAYVLVMSFIGMIAGAVLIYSVAGMIYLAVYGGEVRNGEECARGTAVALLSIFGGAFLGTAGGSALAVNQLRKWT